MQRPSMDDDYLKVDADAGSQVATSVRRGASAMGSNS